LSTGTPGGGPTLRYQPDEKPPPRLAIGVGLQLAVLKPQIVEFPHGVGLQVNADPQGLEVRNGFEHQAGNADLVQGQRGGKPTDTATGNEYGFIHPGHGGTCS